MIANIKAFFNTPVFATNLLSGIGNAFRNLFAVKQSSAQFSHSINTHVKNAEKTEQAVEEKGPVAKRQAKKSREIGRKIANEEITIPEGIVNLQNAQKEIRSVIKNEVEKHNVKFSTQSALDNPMIKKLVKLSLDITEKIKTLKVELILTQIKELKDICEATGEPWKENIEIKELNEKMQKIEKAKSSHRKQKNS